MRLGWISLPVLLVLGCGDAPEVERPLDPDVAALIHDLVAGTDRETRDTAHKALIAKGAAGVKALGELLDREDVDDGTGAWIAEVLGGIGADAAPAAPALGRRLMQGGECAATTSWALGQIGTPGVPHLVKALSSDKAKARIWACQALRVLDEPPAEALDALMVALRDPEREVRFNAAHAMSDYPDLAERWIPALLPLTRDAEEDVRDGAAMSLLDVAAGRAEVHARLREIVLDSGEEARLRESVLEGLDQHLARDAADLAFLRKVAALTGEDDAHLAEQARGMLTERMEK